MSVGLAGGCAGNCEDDGLSQDSPENCAVAASDADGGSTGGAPIPIDTDGSSSGAQSGTESDSDAGSESDTDASDTDSNDTDTDTGSDSNTDSGSETDTDTRGETDSDGDTCANGRLDDGEADIDCGGTCATPCDDGSDCTDPSDCASGVCIDGTCAVATCEDGVVNGTETDVDCGGDLCDPCDDGDDCQDGGDCLSGVCEKDVCVPPSCKDGQQNGSETDIDCGGDTCAPCDDGDGCQDGDDCVSGVCTDDTCTAPTCDDGVHNGDETDVDCGGDVCGPCDDGDDCVEPSDCVSGVCTDDVCIAPACDDGILNGTETDVDCGGDVCGPCEDGETCEQDSDCISDSCPDGTCVPIPNSCLDILLDDPTAEDGTYEIDPDGPGGLVPFDVECDMTTDGGGWTGITPCLAQLLGGTMVAVEPAAIEGIDAQCRPFTQDAGNGFHTYHYTFTFAPSFGEFYLSDYEAQANGSGPGNTADIGPFQQSDWDLCHQGTHGDISFGSAAEDGPVTSFAAEGTDTDTVNAIVPWPAGATAYPVTAGTTDFRIGWGEEGSQSEGWFPWASGSVFVR
jgi:hypothetical protein